jgi:hypothetical protein
MTFKSRTKYTWEGWKSRGQEPLVFSVEHPCELMGAHAKLIDNQLGDSEKIKYCLYSPRVSSTSTPFGLKVEESSRGLCITDNRFIISRDWHTTDIKTRVNSIWFDDILYFNIGKALLLGWFTINYQRDGQDAQENILFGSIGKHHFEKVIRSYKKYSLAVNPDDLDRESFPPGSFIHKIENKIHAEHLKTLLAQGERCFLTFPCRYLWQKVFRKPSFFKKKKAVYPMSKATFLLTNKALLLARDSLGDFIGTGVEVQNIPINKIKSISIAEENLYGYIVQKIKVAFTVGGCAVEMPLVVDGDSINNFIDVLEGLHVGIMKT